MKATEQKLYLALTKLNSSKIGLFLTLLTALIKTYFFAASLACEIMDINEICES